MPARTAPRTGAAQSCPSSHRPALAGPPRAFLDLGAVLTAPGCARAWTRVILWEWGLACLADTAEVVVSELVTNSVNASRALGRPVIRLILTLDRGELAILVRDDHPGAPRTRHPGADEENGRGLLLAEALSDRFGWYPLEQGPGKVTWAVLEAAPAASSDPAARFMPLAPAWPERARHLASGHAGPCTPRAHARQ
jgi:anti-sigma regulatory factor (Ser/Thr protein kinase)